MGKSEDPLRPTLKMTSTQLGITSAKNNPFLCNDRTSLGIVKTNKKHHFDIKLKIPSKNSTKRQSPVTAKPSLFMTNLGGTQKVDDVKEPIKPSLFNKDLAPVHKDSATAATVIKPSLFSLSLRENHQSSLPVVSKYVEQRPQIAIAKSESLIPKKLQKDKLKTKENASTKAGKSCNVKKTVKNKTRRKREARLTMVTANVDNLVIMDDDFKNKQMAIMRRKLKTETNEFFTDTKVLNQDAIKQKKDKVLKLKQQLINMVSVSLIFAPDISDVHNSERISMMKLMKELSRYDPEFILKLALYTRKILNIRVVSTFILAFAAYLIECRPYLKKYFNSTIILPSDWIGVAEIYQTFFDDSLNFGGLPTSLRKVLTEKFEDFDEYQLAKYNKGAKTKTKIVTVDSGCFDFLRDDEEEVDEDGVPYKTYELKSLSLKQLIRKLHISQPAHHVMCLVGKKYPLTLQEFYQSRLPGNFEEELAGKRMKLKTPETWETQVAMKGNKPSTWQDLLDHKKLPFMAMLRNLRNMVSSGMTEKYHKMIIHRLTDEKSVINSKQFPFRFLSAYDIIELMEETLRTGVDVASANYSKKKEKAKDRPILYNQNLLTRYKKALEKALKISTIHNISPIPGVTVIIVDVDKAMSDIVLSKSISPAKRKCLDMALLLAVMCHFHCEDSLFILNSPQEGFTIVDNLPDTKNILQMVHEIKATVKKLWDNEIPQGKYGCSNVTEYMCQFIGQRKMINNLYFVSSKHNRYLEPFISLYRKEVNPAMLCVRQCINESRWFNGLESDYEVNIGGYSDQILKYLGERGTGRQLTAVENVDKTFNLKDVQVRQLKTLPTDITQVKVQRPFLTWRTIRVFISSTFRDMHGERDLLTKYVFPELRCWCYNYCLNLYEVDLRWGITEKQSQSEKQLELCLSEVMRADLFIGILGDRFGWVPSNYDVEDQQKFEWLKEMPKGCSMTELEMRAFLRKGTNNRKALFLFRDPDFLSDVPEKCTDDFITCDEEAITRMKNLRNYITEQENVRVVENYPCSYGGKIENVLYTTDLDHFGKAVLTNVWSAIKENYIENQDEECVEENTGSNKHETFIKEVCAKFVGRKAVLEKVIGILRTPVSTMEHGVGIDKNILVVSGKSGSGKTAFMAKLAQFYIENQHGHGVHYFSEAGPEYQHVGTMIRYLFDALKNEFHVDMAYPENDRELKVYFENLLKSITKMMRKWQKFCIFIDGLESMDKGCYANLLDWIPDVVPRGIYFVISCLDNTPIAKLLTNHRQLISTVKLPALEHSDRAMFVRNTLQQYGKELDESPFNNQMRLLLSKKGAESPLYLMLACEELRLFGVYERLSEYLKSLAQNIPQLIEFVLKRIEPSYGKDLVENVFLLLQFTRKGLTEDELYETLNLLQNVKSWPDNALHDSRCFFDKDRFVQVVPRATFACLCRELKVFLNEDLGTGTISLIHRDIINVIHGHYVAKSKISSLVHFVLACFFRKQVDPNNDLKWLGKDVKALTELPYHMASSGILWKDLHQMLTSVYFMKAKVERGLCLQLLEDLQLNLPLLMLNKRWLVKQKEFLAKDDVKDVTKFISQNIDVLGKYPKLLLQQAVNSPEGSYMQTIISQIPADDVTQLFHWLNKPVESTSCSLTISTIKSPIQCISLSRDGSHVACGTANGDVLIYDKETSKEVNSFSGHTGSITACCYAGNKLCSASTDASISVWDIETGQRLYTMKNHKEPITGCTATQDGKLLVSVSLDKSARLWNLSDGKEAGQFTGVDSPLNCVSIDNDEKQVALGAWNKQIIIWNILENKKAAIYKGHKSSVRALAYSPNGRHLASSGLDGELLLWSTQNGAMIGQLSQLSDHIHHLSFSNDGLKLFGASSDTSIKVWSGTLGFPETSITLPRNDDNPEAIVNDYALSVAVCGVLIAVGYNSGRICTFENNDERQLMMSWKAHASSVRSLCFLKSDSRCKKDLVSASDDHKVIQWRFNSFLKPTLIRTLHGHTDGVTCARAKEAYVLTSSRDYSVRVWNAVLFDENEKESESAATLHGHTGIVTSCDLSPCETKGISCGYDRTMFIWDLVKFTSLCVVHNAHADGVTTCCWSDVGTYIVTGSNDFKLKLWNTKVLIQNANNPEKLTERSVFTGHATTINEVKYKFGCVVSTSADGIVKVWTQNGIEITTFQPHNARINSCDLWAPGLGDENEDDAWAERGKDLTSIQQRVRAKTPKNLNDVKLFTASDDGKVSCWRPFKPDLLEVMFGHSNDVCQVVEGKSNEIISCSLDETIKIWDSTTVSRSNLSTHSGEVTCITVSDADHDIDIATGGRDGRIHLYSGSKLVVTFQTSDKSPVTALELVNENNGILWGTSTGLIEMYELKDLAEEWSDRKGRRIATMNHCPVLALFSFYQYLLVSYSTCINIFKQTGDGYKLMKEDTSKDMNSIEYYNPFSLITKHPSLDSILLPETKSSCCKLTKEELKSALDTGELNQLWLRDYKRRCITIDDDSMIHSVCQDPQRIIIGLSNGHVVLLTNENDGYNYIEQVNKKLHGAAVTGIFSWGDRMVTSSYDATIKVWKLPELRQIGLFSCRSPIVSMKVVDNLRHNEHGGTRIYIGDCIGNVEFLKLNH